MKVLVAFGTTEGQTQKIAHHIETTLGDAGHDCELYNCEQRADAPELSSFDAIIVAASVHQKRHQDAVTDFVADRRNELEGKRTAFISVSLAITMPDGKEEAETYVNGFLEETGWTPDSVLMAAGAVRYLEYDFFKEFTIQQIVFKGQKKMPDKAGINPEYTDWNALDAFVADFLGAA